MKYDKSFLRNKSILLRKKKYSTVKKFNYNLIFRLIRKHFHRKEITIGGYYPSNYEVNILKFLEEASKKKFRITLPVIKSSNKMSYKLWVFKEPLYVNQFGILEPKNSIKENAISLGIAYSFQRCKKIPVNNHDYKLDYIFTEKGIINSK